MTQSRGYYGRRGREYSTHSGSSRGCDPEYQTRRLAGVLGRVFDQRSRFRHAPGRHDRPRSVAPLAWRRCGPGRLMRFPWMGAVCGRTRPVDAWRIHIRSVRKFNNRAGLGRLEHTKPTVPGLLILACGVLSRPRSILPRFSIHRPRAIKWSKPTAPTLAACAVNGVQMKRDRPTCIKTAGNQIADNTLCWDGLVFWDCLRPPLYGQRPDPKNVPVHARICTGRIAPKELNPC